MGGASPKTQSVYGYQIRKPYKSEDDFFANNTETTGMAAEDGRIVLNPYSKLSKQSRARVAENEAIRLFMRDKNINPKFKVTPEQKEFFKGTSYGQPGNDEFMRQTLVARILTKDKSAQNVTDEQRKVAQEVMAQIPQ